MRRAAAVLAIALALALVGCAPAPSYTVEASQVLQASVLAVTETAAAGDPETALTRLDELQTALDAQLASGGIDQERYDSVSAAMGLVRTDLQAAVESELAEETAVTPDDSGPGNSEKPGKPDKPEKPEKPGKDD